VAEPRIDVSIEHKHRPEENSDGAKKHPNTCPSCGSHYRNDELEANLRVCPQCGHHFRVRARERIAQLVDTGTFREEAVDLRSEDPLAFFDLRPYTERLAEAEVTTGLGDAMVIGGAVIENEACQLAVMDFAFMGGSMGSVVGEKLTRAADSAIERRVPLVAITASGGARMQEGILSLMQLPRGHHRLRARGPARVHRPPRCPADDTREASGRLRPRRIKSALRPPRRNPPTIRAQALPRADSATLQQWPVKTRDISASG
jgi:acetyl-CoA carboxylase carboxyl transferase beta subunit